MKQNLMSSARRSLTVVLFLLAGVLAATAATAFAPLGQFTNQPWQAKYYHAWYNNGDPANNWVATDFDDSAWQTISGPLSTADALPYYATAWGDSYRAYWLRRHFTVSSTAGHEYLMLYAIHDNDCRIYLNGKEVYYGSSSVGANAPAVRFLPAELLREGDNLLAVKVRDSGGSLAFIDFGLYNDEVSWLTAEISTPGSLGQEVLYQADVLGDVEFLKVKGTMNGDDWTTVKNMANLKGVDLSEAKFDAIPDEQFAGQPSLSMAKLPAGIKTIGRRAFYQTALCNISIPASVTTIGEDAFSGCKYLFKLEFTQNASLTSVGQNAFYNCSNLQAVALPGSLTVLPYNMFYRCSSLSSVVLPPTLQRIGRYCFSQTSALKHIDLPQGLAEIGHEAFEQSGIEHIVLPTNLTTLGYRCFESCMSLKTVELPATPKPYTDYNSYYGYDYNFYNCPALEKVISHSATPPIIYSSQYPFQGVDLSKVTLVVPAFSVVDYKLDTYWHQFGKIEAGTEPTMLHIASTLSLTNNRRPANKVDILLDEGGSLLVGGNAPLEVGTLTFTANMGPWENQGNFGQLINNTANVSVDQMLTRHYVYADRWYFITPLHDVNVADVVHSNAEASFVFRYYNGQNRATNGPEGSWQDLTDNTLKAGQGYILQTNRQGWLTMPATATGKAAALVSDDASVALRTYNAPNAADASWNYVGNPYPCYYDTYYMNFSAPLTVWDNASRTYRAISIADDDYVLRPMQAFFVQKPDGLSQILFTKEGRQQGADVQRPEGARKANGQGASRQIFDVSISNGEQTDQARVVINAQASVSYETGRDATRFLSTDTRVPQLYTRDAEGNQLAINERPLADGVVALGMQVNQPGTFTLSAPRAATSLLLTDAQTGQTTDLSLQDYTFTVAEAGSLDQRFTLVLSVGITAIDAVTAEGQAADVQIFDLQGRRIEGQPQQGLYIINGKKHVVK